MLREQIHRLCSELSLPPPSEEERGLFLFALRPDVRILLRQLDHGMRFSAPIQALPERSHEDLFLFLMRANFLGRGTGGSSIGLSQDEKTLTLTRTIPYELSYEAFKQNVEEFINFLLYWREEVVQFERARQH